MMTGTAWTGGPPSVTAPGTCRVSRARGGETTACARNEGFRKPRLHAVGSTATGRSHPSACVAAFSSICAVRLLDTPLSLVGRSCGAPASDVRVQLSWGWKVSGNGSYHTRALTGQPPLARRGCPLESGLFCKPRSGVRGGGRGNVQSCRVSSWLHPGAGLPRDGETHLKRSAVVSGNQPNESSCLEERGCTDPVTTRSKTSGSLHWWLHAAHDTGEVLITQLM